MHYMQNSVFIIVYSNFSAVAATRTIICCTVSKFIIVSYVSDAVGNNIHVIRARFQNIIIHRPHALYWI